VKVYLAARYDRALEMCRVALLLQEAGHEVTSRWIKGHDSTDPAVLARFAQEDIEDVAAADVLMLFTEPNIQGTRGGRHVEFGIALALGKRIVLVGVNNAKNIFQHLPEVYRAHNVERAIELLRRFRMPT
jgi:hypothetical protein